MSSRDHHQPCACGAELADECPRCEARGFASLTAKFEALKPQVEAEIERRKNVPTCPTCGSDGDPYAAKDGSTCPNPFHAAPVSSGEAGTGEAGTRNLGAFRDGVEAAISLACPLVCGGCDEEDCPWCRYVDSLVKVARSAGRGEAASLVVDVAEPVKAWRSCPSCKGSGMAGTYVPNSRAPRPPCEVCGGVGRSPYPAPVVAPSDTEAGDTFEQCPHEAARATCPDPCGCSCGRQPCRVRPAPVVAPSAEDAQ